MKVNRTYCIKEEFVELLKRDNASATINDLLEKHYAADVTDNIDEMRKRIAELVPKKRQIMAEIRHFKAKIIEKQAKIDKKKTINLSEHKQALRKSKVELMKDKWQREEITDEEFYAFCDK